VVCDLTDIKIILLCDNAQKTDLYIQIIPEATLNTQHRTILLNRPLEDEEM
jgi:hypothetical protein